MTLFESFVTKLQAGMETPAAFGLFHIAFLLLTVLAAVLLVWRFRDAEEKTVRRILLITWTVLLVMELYKQLVFSYREDLCWPGHMMWGYQWYSFPFQLCSSPLYMLPLAALLKDGRFKDAVTSFLATFSVFGGLAVMLYPNDVFVGMIGINIQTMLHHGAQIAIGVLLAARNRKRWTLTLFCKGILPFTALCAVALLLNEIMYAYFQSGTVTDVYAVFNMFYISRHYGCSLPLLSAVYLKVPYPVFLLVYVLGFVLVAALIFLIEKGCIRLAARLGKKAA